LLVEVISYIFMGRHNISVQSWSILKLNNTDRHPFNGLSSRTTWVSWHQNNGTNVDFNEAKDDGVALTSAGPYTHHLHFAADRQPCQHPITQFCYRSDAFPDAQPTVSKYWGEIRKLNK